MKPLNHDVDHYLAEGCGRCSLGGTPECKVHFWTEELKLLRNLVLSCGLSEEVKWGMPCYTFQNNNVLIVSAFKDFCSINFFKGALLQDGKKLLEKQGDNTQGARIAKFTNTKKIVNHEATLKAYIFEAIEVEKAGLKVEYKKNPEPIPDELQEKFNGDPIFKGAFESLTPGRRRGYILHFSQPKQTKTRIDRIEKCIAKILNGKGLHDDYKSR